MDKEPVLTRPVPGTEHHGFYRHLLAGGALYRDDRLNNVRQVITLETLGGDAARIQLYGYQDLSILPAPDAKPNEAVWDNAVRRAINHANGLHDAWTWGLNPEMDRLMALLRDDLAEVAARHGRPLPSLPGQDADADPAPTPPSP